MGDALNEKPVFLPGLNCTTGRVHRAGVDNVAANTQLSRDNVYTFRMQVPTARES